MKASQEELDLIGKTAEKVLNQTHKAIDKAFEENKPVPVVTGNVEGTLILLAREVLRLRKKLKKTVIKVQVE